jgi:hypothetical protein
MWMRKERTMTASTAWTAFHHRGEVLRTVTDEADLRRDGVLPMHLPGVTETFRDERHLADQPMDLESAVRDAWVATAEELPGIRAVIDRHVESPTTAQMQQALDRALAKERVLLATTAGRASQAGHRAEAVGREIEEAARASYQPAAPMPTRVPTGSAAFVARIKAVLAA